MLGRWRRGTLRARGEGGKGGGEWWAPSIAAVSVGVRVELAACVEIGRRKKNVEGLVGFLDSGDLRV